MATHSSRLIQDQNLNIHHGVPIGGKTNVSKAQKKGEIGGRKALIDISNSAKPFSFQSSKKHNSINVISIGEDPLGISKTGKTNVSKGNRKALSDLTNSVKPSVHQVPKKSQDNKKVIAVMEEESFLHNHQDCIKAQMKTLDIGYFLKTVGLDDDISVKLASPMGLPVSAKLKPESQLNLLEMEEEDMISEVKIEVGEHGSPKSPKLNNMQWWNNNPPNFVLMETQLPNY